MEVRSYYATTVEPAMSLARTELGPEAMLIQSNRTTPDLAHLGRYEVVFAGEIQAAQHPHFTPQTLPEPANEARKFPFPAVQLPMRPPSVVKGSKLSPEQSAILLPVDLLLKRKASARSPINRVPRMSPKRPGNFSFPVIRGWAKQAVRRRSWLSSALPARGKPPRS